MKRNLQAEYERMYHALKRIAKVYQTPAQIRRTCEKQYGLSYEETLEMAYENIQLDAAEGIRGIRLQKTSPSVSTEQSPKTADGESK